ncbi:MBL fold metallo-hydrolase [Aeromicrobium chenweiae]|uniref:MBL fold hydrolase n=1 Tax=Aeromicrobium chenweiae TaxID=2079793 RepID=A0A2S0WM99_9ACTN|nr:MBL fold metallo-hydrolase [Aeromicrobium chenweiae]AWB92473.1 MBL fold hydrolase [Aeromicrobium chenweiae]TGN31235.1 MBL fold metallo-hydrolase [Aeromicrobium chenweiae]
MPALETPIEGLRATPPSRLPYQHDVLLRTFVLERPAGNVLVYNSPGITTAAHEIQALGGAARLLINHSHEAMYGTPGIEVPAYVHDRDHDETARSMSVAGTFAERHVIDNDLEAIPTPGHTAGTTSFLWDNGRHRHLFTGDFIWIEHGEWKAVVLDDRLRGAYLDSLALVRDLDFDVLVPWGTTEGDPCFAVADRAEIRERIDAIIARVESGSAR